MAFAESLDSDVRLRLIVGIWSSLPASHSAAPSAKVLAELRPLLESYDAGHIDKFPWATVKQMMSEGIKASPSKVYSAPRRFDLATIFVVTIAYSLLFGAMKALSFPPAASALVAGFISLIGAGQAFLFRGEQPRTASLVVDAIIYTAAMLLVWIITGPRLYSTSMMLIMLGYTIVGGALLGYLAGRSSWWRVSCFRQATESVFAKAKHKLAG